MAVGKPYYRVILGWSSILTLSYLSGMFSVSLNLLQVLNGLMCFSRVKEFTSTGGDFVTQIGVSGFGANYFSHLEDFCIDPATFKSFGSPSCKEAWEGVFICQQDVQKGKSLYSHITTVNCTSGDHRPVQSGISVSPGSVTMQLSQSEKKSYGVMAVSFTSSCSLDRNFYIIYTYFFSFFALFVFLIRYFLRFRYRRVSSFLCHSEYRWIYSFLSTRGFFDFCDKVNNKPMLVRKGELYTDVSRSFSESRHFSHPYIKRSQFGVYSCFHEEGRTFAEVDEVNSFERVELESSVCRDRVCLYLESRSEGRPCFVEGEPHNLDLHDFVALIKEGFYPCEKTSEETLTLYGRIDLQNYTEEFFGSFSSSVLNYALAGNLRKPNFSSIKCAEWKVYLSDLYHHLGERKGSKVRKMRESGSLLRFYEKRKAGLYPSKCPEEGEIALLPYIESEEDGSSSEGKNKLENGRKGNRRGEEEESRKENREEGEEKKEKEKEKRKRGEKEGEKKKGRKMKEEKSAEETGSFEPESPVLPLKKEESGERPCESIESEMKSKRVNLTNLYNTEMTSLEKSVYAMENPFYFLNPQEGKFISLGQASVEVKNFRKLYTFLCSPSEKFERLEGFIRGICEEKVKSLLCLEIEGPSTFFPLDPSALENQEEGPSLQELKGELEILISNKAKSKIIKSLKSKISWIEKINEYKLRVKKEAEKIVKIGQNCLIKESIEDLVNYPIKGVGAPVQPKASLPRVNKEYIVSISKVDKMMDAFKKHVSKMKCPEVSFYGEVKQSLRKCLLGGNIPGNKKVYFLYKGKKYHLPKGYYTPYRKARDSINRRVKSPSSSKKEYKPSEQDILTIIGKLLPCINPVLYQQMIADEDETTKEYMKRFENKKSVNPSVLKTLRELHNGQPPCQ